MILNKKKLFLIAEIGINHNGSLKIAKKLIYHASKAGFNAVKFQTYKTENLIDRKTPVAYYQKEKEKKQFDLLKKYEFTFSQFLQLKKYCKKKKILFISTPFDNESALFLNKINVQIFKVSSADLDNFHLLSQIKKFNKHIILSTGMADALKLKKTLKFLKLKKNRITILHCISNYPVILRDTELGFINEIKKTKYNYGLSDHTVGNEQAIAAIAMGAKVIEKHITLDKKMSGPDHKCSLEVKNFKNFIKTTSDIFISIKNSKKKMNSYEKKILEVTQRRLFCKNKIKKNNEIKMSDIIALRSTNKKILKIDEIFKIIGKKSKKNYEKGSFFTKNDI